MFEHNTEVGKDIPPQEVVSNIKLTDVINGKKKGQLVEQTGLVTLQGLPFRWRVFRGVIMSGDIYLLAPIKPDHFNPNAKYSQPIPVSVMGYVLKELQDQDDGRREAVNRDTVGFLYNRFLDEHEKAYDDFDERYKQDPLLRRTFCDTVSAFCRETNR